MAQTDPTQWWLSYPMPSNWEVKYDFTSKKFFYIDHSTKKTSWDDPRPAYYSQLSQAAAAQKTMHPSLPMANSASLVVTPTTQRTMYPLQPMANAASPSGYVANAYSGVSPYIATPYILPTSLPQPSNKPNPASPNQPSQQSRHVTITGLGVPQQQVSSSSSPAQCETSFIAVRSSEDNESLHSIDDFDLSRLMTRFPNHDVIELKAALRKNYYDVDAAVESLKKSSQGGSKNTAPITVDPKDRQLDVKAKNIQVDYARVDLQTIKDILRSCDGSVLKARQQLASMGYKTNMLIKNNQAETSHLAGKNAPAGNSAQRETAAQQLEADKSRSIAMEDFNKRDADVFTNDLQSHVENLKKAYPKATEHVIKEALAASSNRPYGARQKLEAMGYSSCTSSGSKEGSTQLAKSTPSSQSTSRSPLPSQKVVAHESTERSKSLGVTKAVKPSASVSNVVPENASNIVISSVKNPSICIASQPLPPKAVDHSEETNPSFVSELRTKPSGPDLRNRRVNSDDAISIFAIGPNPSLRIGANLELRSGPNSALRGVQSMALGPDPLLRCGANAALRCGPNRA